MSFTIPKENSNNVNNRLKPIITDMQVTQDMRHGTRMCLLESKKKKKNLRSQFQEFEKSGQPYYAGAFI